LANITADIVWYKHTEQPVVLKDELSGCSVDVLACSKAGEVFICWYNYNTMGWCSYLNINLSKVKSFNWRFLVNEIDIIN